MALCNICIPHIPVGYAGGTTPRMGEVEQRMERLPRATQEQLPRTRMPKAEPLIIGKKLAVDIFLNGYV